MRIQIIFYLFTLVIVGCSSPYKVDTKSNYEYASEAIARGDYDAGYRLLESYFDMSGNTDKNEDNIHSKAIQQLQDHPQLLVAALNTFTRDKFLNTLKRHKGRINTARSEEISRLNIFKKVAPEKYIIAADNFKSFFGITPENFQTKDTKQATSFANRKDIKISKNGNFISLKSKGNLEVTKPISCVDIHTLSSEHTPADIFTGISECIKNNDFSRATKLYALALAYGRYDQLRMIDKSSRGAISVLQFTHLSGNDKATQKKLKDHIQTYSASNKDKTKFTAMCDDIKKLGKPTYYPNYMIKHGMSAFTGGASGISPNFDEEENWKKVYNKFIQCPLT